MPLIPIHLVRLCRTLAPAVLLAGFAALQAMEPPPKGAMEKYRQDGTFDARVRAAKAMGNHVPKPELLQQAEYRVRMEAIRKGLVSADVLPTPPPAWRGMPTTGTVNILVLLVDFSDYPHDETKNSEAKVASRVFGDGDGAIPAPYESLRNYYRRSSFNQLEITGNVLGWYRPAYTRASIAQTTTGRQNLIKEALNSYNAAGHDFSQYDNNGDGRIDYFAVIWSGPDTGWSNFWWGYQTSFSDSTYKLDGKSLADYSWQWESNPVGGNFSANTLIHETGHALGLPDYYDYDDTVGPQGGVGGLDMMDAARGDHNCFSKFVLGWINPSVYKAAATGVALRSAEDAPGDAAIVMPDAVAGDPFREYFMVQNRRRIQNDVVFPTDGLLVWHVDARLNAGATDYLYNNSYTDHKLLRLMEADTLEEIEQGGNADAGDFYTSGKVFGPTSLPSSKKYDGLNSWIGIRNISAAGTTMTLDVFTVTPDATIPTGAPSQPSGSASGDTATFQWTLGTAVDPDSGISGFELQVGTTAGGSDVFSGAVGNVLTRTLTGLDMTVLDGKSLYARVRALNGAALGSAWSPVSAALPMALPTFDCSVLETCSLVFKTQGPWTIDAATGHSGSSARSAAIPDMSTTLLQTRVAGPGNLSFWWRVSSEAGYDFLSFLIDGVEQPGKISGEKDWAQVSLAVPAGSHLLTWRYAKDESYNEGADAGWIDTVSYLSTGGITITTQPTSKAAKVGQTATFSVAATTDGGTIAYQWYRKRASETVYTAIPGATATNHTTPVLALGDSGSMFFVRMTNGSTTQDTVRVPLNVTPVVTITTQPVMKSVTAGQTATFSVAASSNAGTIAYQWFRKRASETVYTAISGATGASCTTSATTAADNLSYYFVRLTDAGTVVDSNRVPLMVKPTITITTQPLSRAAFIGQTASFSVAASTSAGTISYQWYRKRASETVYTAISGATTANLTTPILASTDNGSYFFVRLTNSGTVVDSARVPLAVKPVVTITTQPVATTKAAGQTATFSVAATTNGGAITYQWYRKRASETVYTALSGATAASFTTGALAASDHNAYYFVRLTNGATVVDSLRVPLTVTP